MALFDRHTARKRHRCVNAAAAERGNPAVADICKRVIEKGEQYVEGDANPYEAGGFGFDRGCLACAEAGCV